MTLLDISIVNVALPSIRSGLNASVADLQWVLSGYALTFGLVLVPAGRLGDARGRRGVFMVGLGLFTLASAAAGLAPGPGWLSAARFVQGAAGGLANPQVAGLIQQLFRGAERGTAFGLLGATISVSTAVGPLLGGAIIHLAGPADGWRWVFYVNVPVGALALPLAYRFLPPGTPRGYPAGADRSPGRRRHPSLDPVGVTLLGTAVLLLLLPLIKERDWPGRGKWLLVPLAFAVLAAFVGWERRCRARGDAPLVDLTLFRVRSYALGVTIAMLYFAGFTAIFFMLTLYLQNGLGYSPLLAGVSITPFALGSAAASALGGRTATRLGRPLVTTGLLLVAVGLAATEVADRLAAERRVGLALAVPLLVAGVGSGLVISPNQTLTLARVPVSGGGSAAGVLQTAQRIGSAVGIAAVGSVFFATVAGSGGQWALGFRRALWVAIAFVAAALSVAVVDVASRRGKG
jgi:EmrB/QacA subfamily drug resistance transporter